MLPKNLIITSLLMVFSVATFGYRYWDVYFKKYGLKGTIYYQWTLTLLGIIHSLIGFLAIWEYLFFRSAYNVYVGLLSLGLFIGGQWVRNRAIKELGPYHSPHIEIKKAHPLIETFPYNKIRHPYYLGVIIEVLTTPLVLNAYFAFMIAILLYLPALVARIYLEEKVHHSIFGEAYTRFCKQRTRFIPGVI